MNVVMAKTLASRFDVLYMTYNIIVFFIGFVLSFRRRIAEIVGCALGLLSILCIPFFDALPNTLRTWISTYILGFTIVYFLLYQVALYHNWFRLEGGAASQIRIGEMVWTGESIMADALVSIIILLTKFFKAAVVHPEEFTVFTIRVQSKKVTRVQLAFLKAAHDVKRKKSKI